MDLDNVNDTKVDKALNEEPGSTTPNEKVDGSNIEDDVVNPKGGSMDKDNAAVDSTTGLTATTAITVNNVSPQCFGELDDILLPGRTTQGTGEIVPAPP